MRRHRNVKIVATLGPSSSDLATIRALFEAGADVFRLNMSHGDHAEQKARYDAIRAVEAEMGRPIAVAPIPDEGLGAAINDRLRRAAAPR